jgi:hypothetical protein
MAEQCGRTTGQQYYCSEWRTENIAERGCCEDAYSRVQRPELSRELRTFGSRLDRPLLGSIHTGRTSQVGGIGRIERWQHQKKEQKARGSRDERAGGQAAECSRKETKREQMMSSP